MEGDLIGSVIRAVEGQRRYGCHDVPNRKAIIGIIADCQAFLFPGFQNEHIVSDRMLLEKIRFELAEQIGRALNFSGDRTPRIDPAETADEFVRALPEVHGLLLTDVEALYEGDPAAVSREEVIIAYPGFFAILVFRLAHELYRLKVPIVPRIMTEFAHQRTGIDIHPGATVGPWFFIDHGTGIVIGETTVIGEHVKLYQGVTLGAKSFEVDEEGNPVKGIKRHPNIGSHVVIYANATILGGSTTVGDGCVIGGNVWLTHSVPAGKTVYYSGDGPQEPKP